MLSHDYVRLNRPLGDQTQGLYKLVLRSAAAEKAIPGQFVNIRVSDSYDPLLRRPLSIAGIDRQKGEITIYYRVKGRGTALLAAYPEGSTLDVLGPLGNGFSLAGMLNDPEPEVSETGNFCRPQDSTGPINELVLVAGGIGIFPLYALLEHMLNHTRLRALPLTVIWGVQDQAFLKAARAELLDRLRPEQIQLATMDGSAGQKGLVTSPLERHLGERLGARAGAGAPGRAPEWGRPFVAACGPNAMLEAVVKLCTQFGVDSEICLEEHMACGLGACLGCTCTLQNADGTLRRGRVCLEGPVFSGKEVVWHAES